MSLGQFGAGFLKAFVQAKQQKAITEQDKKEKDARLKLFEVQLEREKAAQQQQQIQSDQLKQQLGARQQLFDRLGGLEAMPGTGVKIADPTAKTPSLTELLADPESAMQLLQSGLVGSKDVLENAQQQKMNGLLQKVMGGGSQPAGMELSGLKVGPSGQMMPDFSLPQITSPQTIQTPGGPRLQTFNPRTGSMVADLGIPKPDNVAPEVAGRISGLVQAQQIAGQIRGQFIKPDGSVDKQLVMTSFANLPKSKGREIRNDIGIAVDAVLRARTGAGVNVTEMKQVVDQFLPSPLDSDEQIASKLDRLDQFVSGTLDIATLPPAIRKRIETNVKKQIKESPAVIDFSELPE